MQVYIVKINYDYEGFRIDSIYESETLANERAKQLESNSRLPFDHINHELAGDRVDVECYEVFYGHQK